MVLLGQMWHSSLSYVEATYSFWSLCGVSPGARRRASDLRCRQRPNIRASPLHPADLQSHSVALAGYPTPISVMVGLSLGEQNFIKGGIAQDLRTDGRKRLAYRPIFVETGVIPQASGSARVKLGATDVIASVKAELGKPNPSHPNKGKVSIYVDCSPTAEPTFEGRGGDELSTELSSALQRCLLGGKSGAGAGIDLSSLSIVEGKVCWDLYIDGLVVSSDGNVLDALGAAIKAALSNTVIPKVQVAANASSDEQPEVDVSDEEFLQFDTSAVPVIITLTKVGKHYIVDATTEEESQMSSAVSVSINRQGRICGLTKRGGAGLDPSIILDMISVAKHVSEQLINKLDSEIAAAEACDEETEMDS
ncbi:UNVERIFIED_CONTAM: Exosome complex component RRP42 [Sesamum latifolium]|uniref:Ribosomal RNA-processing protein 42 n=1 Tax=Sesamum latifolium TaxID=2727402 RepID=A0AAW2XWH3_9LAMI